MSCEGVIVVSFGLRISFPKYEGPGDESVSFGNCVTVVPHSEGLPLIRDTAGTGGGGGAKVVPGEGTEVGTGAGTGVGAGAGADTGVRI
jgi:hypothetical protein